MKEGKKMREILFRGKREETQEWVEGDLLIDSCKDVSMREDHCTLYYDILPETVGQYTGLTDKNGKKIFEGDIVRLKRFGNIECGKIVFNTNTAGFEFWREVTVGAYGKKSTAKENLRELISSCVTIIGNIHDNPELLEGVEK